MTSNPTTRAPETRAGRSTGSTSTRPGSAIRSGGNPESTCGRASSGRSSGTRPTPRSGPPPSPEQRGEPHQRALGPRTARGKQPELAHDLGAVVVGGEVDDPPLAVERRDVHARAPDDPAG